MRLSKMHLRTLREVPSEAEIPSHILLLRTGMIRKLVSGVYGFMPLGYRALQKVEQIIREEMDRTGAQQIHMSAVQPAELWQESGRWYAYGPELWRLKDRNGRDFCLGPTHEEIFTDIVRSEVSSYRQLPMNLYQVQHKYRDEARPRFGLMRSREFIMKDAYSFDRDDEGADASYRAMYDAYRRVFSRLALKFRPVEADSGSIGGSFSHEFMVLAQTGEDTIVSCKECEYAANVERAESLPPAEKDDAEPPAWEEVFTPAQHTVEEVATFLSVEPKNLIKTLLLDVDGKSVAALVRGDRELNEIKVKNYFKAGAVRMATPEEVTAWSGAPVGFAGPVDLKVSAVIADLELAAREGWVTGGNKADTHLINVSLARDCKVTAYADLRSLDANDPCPRCKGSLEFMRGIEVGHVFKLGLKYSESLKAVFLDENGKEQYIVMGCYGIGVSRVVAACIEQNHDESGIMFPPPVAPFEVILANLDTKSEEVSAKAEELYSLLRGQGLDVLLDDREERPGVKFKDADLVGAPMQLVIGAKGLARGIVEAKDRRSGEKRELPLGGFAAAFAAWKQTVYAGWGMA